MAWEFDTNVPIYQGLIEKIERAVLAGKYAPGQQLPTIRELAAQAGVNPNTVQRAYAELENSGLVNSQRTAGRFVTTDTPLIEARRKETAKQHAETYFKNMLETGYSKEKAVEFINKP